jgi:polyphenol oxidase
MAIQPSFLQSSISNHQIPWSYYYVPRVERSGIIHGFMTRSSNDIIADPSERQRFAEALKATSVVVMQQVHGDEVHLVRDGERPEAGDGVILLEKGVVGIIKTADCLPVILYEPDHPMVAIVHAGWRGTVRRITEKAIKGMVELGAQRDKMGAMIGPGIGPCCYRVGPEVIVDFRRAGFSERIFSKKDEEFFLDLKAANREMIEAEGVGQIDDIGLCTSCRQDLFFSARNDKQAGRLVNFVLLKR